MKGRPAIEALEYLTLLPQKAAKLIYAVLKSAVANAEHNAKLPKEALHVENVIIQQGPVIKRYMPRARGSASPIRKPMSHIFVTLSSNN
jgi:large subunit ribosomal protein L22